MVRFVVRHVNEKLNAATHALARARIVIAVAVMRLESERRFVHKTHLRMPSSRADVRLYRGVISRRICVFIGRWRYALLFALRMDWVWCMCVSSTFEFSRAIARNREHDSDLTFSFVITDTVRFENVCFFMNWFVSVQIRYFKLWLLLLLFECNEQLVDISSY